MNKYANKRKKKKINSFDAVKNDLLYLQKSLHSLIPSLIGNIVVNCDDTNHFIGNNVGTITIENYSEKHIEITENRKYTFSLFDGSLVCAFYCFDSSGGITSFSLSFLPNCESDSLFEKNMFDYKGEYYIRIDYEPDSFVENTHSKVHMHTTLLKRGVRIPVDRIVLLSEFLYFVLKTVYGANGVDGLQKYILSIDFGKSSKNQLTKDELSTFFLHC